MPERNTDPGRWFASFLPFLGSVVVFILLFTRFRSGGDDWIMLGKVAAALFIAAAVAALIRFSLAPVTQRDRPTTAVDPAIAMRSRIAPLVLGVGSVAIIVLALAIIVTLALLSLVHDELPNKIDTLLTGIFTAVLPVFATWVGTVIAFYFSETAYKEAAKSTRAAIGGSELGKPRVRSYMNEYDSINKLDVQDRPAADAVTIKRVRDQLGEVRDHTYIFEAPKKNPVYLIKKQYLSALTDDQTVQDYRTQTGRGIDLASDAKKLAFVKEDDTLEQAMKTMLVVGSAEAFVTKTGQASEEVIGWITKETLQRNGGTATEE